MSHELGRFVRMIRKRDKITQSWLAHVAGVKPVKVLRLERQGRWPTSAKELDTILGALAYLSDKDAAMRLDSAADVWLGAAQLARERHRLLQQGTDDA